MITLYTPLKPKMTFAAMCPKVRFVHRHSYASASHMHVLLDFIRQRVLVLALVQSLCTEKLEITSFAEHSAARISLCLLMRTMYDSGKFHRYALGPALGRKMRAGKPAGHRAYMVSPRHKSGR